MKTGVSIDVSRLGLKRYWRTAMGLLILASCESMAQTTVSFHATHDATVKSSSASSNYGTAKTLEVDTGTNALLKFYVSGISGTITSAKVRLYVTNSSRNGAKIYRVSNNYASGSAWTETTVNFNNQPSVVGSLIADIGSVTSGRFIEYNVTSVVQANGTFSFVLKPDTSDGMDVSSRQASTGANRPVLRVTYSGTTPTPVPTASLTASPASIEPGGSSTLKLSSSNVTSCTGSGFSTGGAVSGNFSVSPSATKSYSVSCTGPDGSATASATVTVSSTPPPSDYVDDTFSSLQSGAPILALSGSYGYTPYMYDAKADGKALILDARNAKFLVANSRNSSPTASNDCSEGSLDVNRYPVNVYNADHTAIVGALVDGLVPQASDWEVTYHGVNESCNSAALHFKEAAYPMVDGARVHAAWDAVRPTTGSIEPIVKNSWFSGNRDDVVENDKFHNLQFIDNLVDGAFQIISVREDAPNSSNTVTIRGNVIRVRSYLYKGQQQFGSLYKASSNSPANKIYDTVLAVDPSSGSSTWSSQWSYNWSRNTGCGNNLFLWMSDEPLNSNIGNIPSCFKIVKGQAARDLYNQAKANWINCHPKVRRIAGDPPSDFSKCQANTFGGYTN
jgi:hypothetical protein